jgi:hypothetical protein
MKCVEAVKLTKATSCGRKVASGCTRISFCIPDKLAFHWLEFVAVEGSEKDRGELLDQTRFNCGVRKSMKTIWTGYDPTRHVKPTSALGSRLKKRAGRELSTSTMTCTSVRGHTRKTLRSLMLDYSLAWISQLIQDGSVGRFTICAGMSRLGGSFGAGFFLGFLVSRRLASLLPIATY